MTTSPQPRGPLSWILIIGGVLTLGCCAMTGLLATLGVLASEPEPAEADAPPGHERGGGEFLIAGEVARGTSMTTSLPGGRWMDQSGSAVQNVVGRTGTYQWVQTNTAGSLYELSFDDDGSYVWNWASKMTINGMKSESHCAEKGAYELSGTQLTLKPESQKCMYTNSGQAQEKEDEDLSERAYQVFDLTLETLSDPKQQLPGVFMSGPRPKWDTGSGEVLTMKLQRHGED